jgi:soluble lytic murein transglycosylase-like protein
LPHKPVNAAFFIAIAFLIVSYGASADDSVASRNDVTKHEPASPSLTLPVPLSDDDPVTGNSENAEDGEPSPILTLPVPFSDDDPVVGYDENTEDGETPPALGLPAATLSDDDNVAGHIENSEDGETSPILALPMPLSGDDTVAAENDVTDQGASSPILAMPTPLSDSDEALYRQIFALQKKGRWRKADRSIAKLNNKLLLGHVLGQRYLHPTHYRSRFGELAKWLRKYADHPEAKRIHKLAVGRKPGRARAPTKPRTRRPVFHGESGNGGYEPTLLNGLRYSRRTARIQRYIRRLVRRERLSVAEAYLKKNSRRLPAPHGDISRSRIAAGWFFLGNDRKAFELADGAARRSGRFVPFAHWYAGLAAYRMGNASVAAFHFERMAEMKGLSGWHRSGAAFWAARANMVAKQPAKVSHWLAIAADYPRTFYGIIGRRLLGVDSPFRWNDPILEDDSDIAKAFSDIRAQRALALIQVEQHYRAETELRQLAKASSTQTKLALVAIADQVGLPALALRAASSLEGVGGRRIERGLYPLPHWTPKNGFIVDRALIFAVMRQESAFNSRARSGAGARGLMQLMPATAGYMAKRRFRGRARNKLYDPAFNMMLGQKYLRYLIRREGVEGNLFMMAAAYNGGPGNLAKWKRRTLPRSKDPLMFIESIPARETRDFVERVLSNLWMYRERLGQAVPSLDAIAAGELPLYKALDQSQIADANYGRN